MPTPGHVLAAERLRAWPPLPKPVLRPGREGLFGLALLVLVAVLAACNSGSGSAPVRGQGTSGASVSTAASTGSARRPAPVPEAPETSHFERIPLDAATKAKASLAAFVEASATDMRAYHAFRRAVSCGEPFFRERRAEAEALFGAPDDPTRGPLGRLDEAVLTGDRQAIDKEAAAVKQALSALQTSFEKDRVRLPRVVVMLPRTAYFLGAILAGSKPGIAFTGKGALADAQGHLDAIEQMVTFNNQYVSPSPDYGPAMTRVGERIAVFRKAFAAAEPAGALNDRASLVVQTGQLVAALQALLGPSSDLWKPPAPAISVASCPSGCGHAEPTSVLTLPRLYGPPEKGGGDSKQGTSGGGAKGAGDAKQGTSGGGAKGAGDAKQGTSGGGAKGAGDSKQGASERPWWSAKAPIDRFARGDEKALSAEDRLGFDVAAGKGRCFSCHVPPLFGVAAPPEFKGDTLVVPTLRNVHKTAPYFHDGALPTLESVIDFYDAGGGARSPDSKPALHKLDLTPAEKKALLRFLRVTLAEP